MRRRRPVLTAVLLAAALLAGGAVPGIAEERRPRPKPHTRQVQGVRTWAYERLEHAHEALAAGDYAAAARALGEMKQNPSRLNAHEQALLWQTYGYVHAAQEHYAEAAAAFERSLAGDALPEAAANNARYNLAQLYVMTERYDDAIRTFEVWLETAPNPPPDAYYMLATAYVQKGDHAAALPWAQKAVAGAQAPRESWLQLLLSILVEQRRYREAVPVLEQLATRFPRKSHLTQLSAVYSELGESKKALGALELAYLQGLLTEDRELRQLAQLYAYNDVPYRAARLLEKEMAAGRVQKDHDAWELLASSWLRARELDRALEPLRHAAETERTGEGHLRLAQVYLEREQWAEARAQLAAALRRGGLRSPGQAQILLGIANVNEERWDDARAAFEAAAADAGTATQARQWLASIDGELAVRAAETDGADAPATPEPSAP